MIWGIVETIALLIITIFTRFFSREDDVMFTGIAVGVFILFVIIGALWSMYSVEKQQKLERSNHRKKEKYNKLRRRSYFTYSFQSHRIFS
jgi:hypothetical protein